jgi:phospholipase/lecithinase/hemolysin
MRKITFLSLYVTVLFGAAVSAFAIDFSRFNHLVVFGDSLSDNGNSLVLTQRLQPPSPYGNTYDTSGNPLPDTFPGRWTDGQNWVDYFPLVAPVTKHFGPITPFFADPASGTNVAVAGATSADLLNKQIPYYIKARGTLPGDDLYCVWIGANDFKAPIPPQPQQTAANILSGITALASAGAKQFILVDCPDISLTPEVRATATAQAAKQFVAAVNVLLAVETPLIAWQKQINVTFVDINTIFVPLVLNPAFFGFSNSMDPALTLIPPNYVNVKTNPNSFVFWDGFHPTTNVHKIAAQFIYRVASSRFPFSILSSR